MLSGAIVTDTAQLEQPVQMPAQRGIQMLLTHQVSVNGSNDTTVSSELQSTAQ